MDIRIATSPDEVADAIAIDARLPGSPDRADYISKVAGVGGLSVASLGDEVQAFCCVDHQYFFEKPFVSLLVVSEEARRLGLGSGLLASCAVAHPELWTSTNRSNAEMHTLLKSAKWLYCGDVSGLDPGDPECFYRTDPQRKFILDLEQTFETARHRNIKNKSDG